MRKPYLVPILASFLFVSSAFAQEISFAPIGEQPAGIPVYKDVKPIAELNTAEECDAYPWVSGDGLRLYFTRGANAKPSKLFVASRATVNDMFADAQPVSDLFPDGSMSCYLTSDENEIWFTSGSAVYRATRSNPREAFNEPVRVELSGVSGFISAPNITPGGEELFIYNNATERMIIRCVKTGENAYELADVLEFPAGYLPGPGQLSKDGLKYYVALSGEDGAGKLYVLSRTALDQPFGNAAVVPGINDFSNMLDQPSVSADGSTFVMIHTDGSWNSNELYVSTGDAARSKPIARNYDSSLDIYPNPFNASATLSFKLEKGEQVKISLFNLSGTEVATLENSYMSEGEHLYTLDGTKLQPGTYIARVMSGSSVKAKRVVITD